MGARFVTVNTARATLGNRPTIQTREVTVSANTPIFSLPSALGEDGEGTGAPGDSGEDPGGDWVCGHQQPCSCRAAGDDDERRGQLPEVGFHDQRPGVEGAKRVAAAGIGGGEEGRGGR